MSVSSRKGRLRRVLAVRGQRWLRRARRLPPARRLEAFIARHRRSMPVVFFFGGVAWDLLTLYRIDAVFDNILLFTYLVLVGALILTGALVTYGGLRETWAVRYSHWYPSAIQFFMGALFSAYVVFYGQSASLTETAFFLVLLVALLVGNEFVHRRTANLYLLLSLYFLCVFAFFTFFIPVVVKRMGYGIFLASGLLSVAVTGGMIAFFVWQRVFRRREALYATGLVTALFVLMNVFYVQNWIPPVPLALRDGGVYHYAGRQGDAFLLRYEKPPWYRFWVESDQPFRYVEGDTVYCFTAIFAPTRLKTEVYHAWAYFDPARGGWVETDRIGYELVGGRDNGYRGVTRKRRVWPGRWRVEVVTGEGRVLGRIRFDIVPAAEPVRAWEEVLYR
ncbi:DUF2914 domain-containing protein [Rhodocaloribacter litoris]|uniref:DUF2914 domain-containing protein n=1 Tax=Rhodocaloribacter litoris TaxID=2558931 RepID=UPI00142115F0|nr:DUF2914 domain-containing protein [Rhodocaloribacter litoris]QXD14074.1 DUF2914 domain-containing protein [Rhodocaloribacter litoris]